MSDYLQSFLIITFERSNVHSVHTRVNHIFANYFEDVKHQRMLAYCYNLITLQAM